MGNLATKFSNFRNSFSNNQPSQNNQQSQVNQQQYQSHQYLNYHGPSLNNLQVYSDDDDIPATDLRKLACSKNISYDLEKNLSLEVKSMHKYFKFDQEKSQTIPVMISVKTKDVNDNKLTAKIEDSKNRPSIDLVCVIDNSGSMSGEKIQNVKKTLEYLLEVLGENDRLCLIIFNSYGTRLSNLKRTNSRGKKELTNIIKDITANGGTSINSGMEIAFKVLKDRKSQNPISSVFLLSDGQDGSAEVQVKGSINNYLPDECFTIHSFGFGSDHDAPLMNKICALKDGNFYYVEKIDQVDEFFADALAGLYSVVAQEIVIDVSINQSKPVQKFFSSSSVSKTYGEMWKVIKQNQQYQIKINQLFSGVSKDFLLDFTVPPQTVSSIEDLQRNSELFNVTLSAVPIDSTYSTKIVKESRLTLTLFTNKEKIAEDSEVNDAVEFNYLRVKASEAIQEAMKQAENNKYDNSKNILQGMISKLDHAHPKNQEKLQIIKRDLVDCEVNSSQGQYQNQGRFKMQCKYNANMNQASQAQDFDLYRNQGQERFRSLARARKS